MLDVKYAAFVSYAHADARRAGQIQRRLQSFRIDRNLAGRITSRGAIPDRLGPIFLDRKNFVGGSELAQATRDALDASANLIVICSTVSASRPAVCEEVRVFRHRHPDRLVIPVIIEGQYPNNYPPSLLFEIEVDGSISDRPNTILGPDLRESADGADRGLAKIIAGLIGLSDADQIYRTEARRQRLRLKGTIFALTAIVVSLSSLSIGLDYFRRQAIEQAERKQRAFNRLSRFSNELIADVGEKMRDQIGIPQTVVADLLEKAEAMVDGVEQADTSDPVVQRTLALALAEISFNHRAQRNNPAAIAAAERSTAIFEKLSMLSPKEIGAKRDYVGALDRLGDAYNADGQGARSKSTYIESMNRAAELFQSNHDDMSIAQVYAVAIEKRADLEFEADARNAYGLYEKSLALRRRMQMVQPDDLSFLREVSVSLSKLGRALLKMDQPNDATTLFIESLAITNKIAQSNPKSSLFKRELAIAHLNTADALKRSGQAESALKHYESGLEAMTELVKSDPKNIDWLSDILIAYQRVGDALLELSKTDAALRTYQSGLAASLALTDLQSTEEGWLAVSAFIQRTCAALLDAGAKTQAAVQAHQGVEIFRRAVMQDPKHQSRLAQAISREAWYRLFTLEAEVSRDLSDRALKLDPDNVNYTVNKLHAICLSGDQAAAKSYFDIIATSTQTRSAVMDSIRDDMVTFDKAKLQIVLACEAAFSE